MSTMTMPPATIEVSVPRMTVMFFGPGVADPATETLIAALLGAEEDMEPPYVGAPSAISDVEVLNSVPGVMSMPPTAIKPRALRGIRTPNDGRVRFKPVVLFGRTW